MQQFQPSPRLQAMLYLAEDLIQHKQYYSNDDKIAIKHILNKYCSILELASIENKYNSKSNDEQFRAIPAFTTIYRLAKQYHPKKI